MVNTPDFGGDDETNTSQSITATLVATGIVEWGNEPEIKSRQPVSLAG